MAGFFRGLALIGAMTALSPVHQQASPPAGADLRAAAHHLVGIVAAPHDGLPASKAKGFDATALATSASGALALGQQFQQLDPQTQQKLVALAAGALSHPREEAAR